MGKEVQSQIIEFALATFSEIPGGGILSAAIRGLLQRRLDDAREILIEELGTGERTIFEDMYRVTAFHEWTIGMWKQCVWSKNFRQKHQ